MTARRIATDDKHYQHVQNTPAKVWTVVHGLGKRPAVSVVDSAETEVHGTVQYDSANQLTLTFSATFSGTAYCN